MSYSMPTASWIALPFILPMLYPSQPWLPQGRTTSGLPRSVGSRLKSPAPSVDCYVSHLYLPSHHARRRQQCSPYPQLELQSVTMDQEADVEFKTDGQPTDWVLDHKNQLVVELHSIRWGSSETRLWQAKPWRGNHRDGEDVQNSNA